jgi:hypothetical protein
MFCLRSIHFNDNEIILSKNQVINAFIKNFHLQEIAQIALEFISGAEVNGFMIWTTSMTVQFYYCTVFLVNFLKSIVDWVNICIFVMYFGEDCKISTIKKRL